MRDALVIIPTYNESDNVKNVATSVREVCPGADVLIVDDNSPDGTGEIADALAAAVPGLHALHRTRKQGLGRAYVAGFRWALERSYTFILEMDADLSHDPTDVPRLIEAAGQADLVLGSRYLEGIRIVNWPLSRLILSKGASLYVRAITGMPFTDPTGGFKCFRRSVLQAVDLNSIHSNGYSFQIEMTHRAWRLGFRIAEVPIVFVERRSGESKMDVGIVREALWMVWKILLRSRCRRHPGEAHPQSIVSQGRERA
jgi:dolichol-phosphate mannosyltransferase